MQIESMTLRARNGRTFSIHRTGVFLCVRDADQSPRILLHALRFTDTRAFTKVEDLARGLCRDNDGSGEPCDVSEWFKALASVAISGLDS